MKAAAGAALRSKQLCDVAQVISPQKSPESCTVLSGLGMCLLPHAGGM